MSLIALATSSALRHRAISAGYLSTKRRHGLRRCRYKGLDGMQRWVGYGIITDNLINLGRALHAQS